VTRRFAVLAVLIGFALLGVPSVVAHQASATPAAMSEETPVYGYRVVAEFPHDRQAFTQGLVFLDGVLYEGTGLNGESTLRRVDLKSGEVLQSVALNPAAFGEGIAVMDDHIYQLTWKNKTAVLWDRKTFEPLEVFSYDTEGWGLTTDGEQLIMSDGTNRLYFRDPKTFDVLSTIDVFDGDRPVANLNELEYVDGKIWANVWQTDLIAQIDPDTGNVVGWIDLRGLLSEKARQRHEVDVLNGIAVDPATGHIYVTGKLWPKLFEIELVPEEH